MFSLLQRCVITCLALAIASMLFTSCRSVFMYAYGIRKPKIEREASLNQFVTKLHINEYPQAVSSFDGYLNNLQLGVIDANVFAKNGQLIRMPANNSACGPDPAVFLRTINKNNRYNYHNSLHLDSFSTSWLSPNGLPFNYKQSDSADFVVVLTWSKWAGRRMIKRDVRSCLEAIQANTQTHIQVVLLNMDKQQLWGKENNSKVTFTKNTVAVRK